MSQCLNGLERDHLGEMVKNKKRTIALIFAFFFAANFNVWAQSGGDFTITQSVIASGGFQNAVGGTFSVDGTIGQPVGGRSIRGSTFAITSGFWNFTALGPTAAQVSVSGQVRTVGGLGIPNAVLTITSQTGSTQTVSSSSFGYYSFNGVAAGATYIVSISTKRYSFNQPTIFVSVTDETTDLDFVAEPLP